MKSTWLEKAADPFKGLFWRVQIGILRACPPLCGLVSTFSMGAANSSKLWVKTLFRLAICVPNALLEHLRNKLKRRIVLSRISVVVTTRCTLNCDKCLAHIPDLSFHEDASSEDLIEDIRSLYNCVDYIYALILSGGEAFLHPELDKILLASFNSAKVGDISVQTNGTVMPSEAVLAALQTTNATVKISRYSKALQPNVEQLKDKLQEYNIRHTHESGTAWRDIGTFGKRQPGNAKKRFRICVQQLCLPYYDGTLHLCGESALQMAENSARMEKDDYINLRQMDREAFRIQLKRLEKKRVIAACSFCLGNTYQTPATPVAAQRL